MDKWLTQFSNKEQYNNFLNSSECPRVNVSYVVNEDATYYYKDTASSNFFTITFVDDNNNLRKQYAWEQYEYIKMQIRLSTDTVWTPWIDWTDRTFNTGDRVRISAKLKDENLNKGQSPIFTPYIENREDGNDHRMDFSGNIMSLVYGDDFLTYPLDDDFKLTGDWAGARNISGLNFPRVIKHGASWDGCCQGMFNGNGTVNSLPILPCTTVPAFCYYEMFKWNTGLTDLSSYHIKASNITDHSLNNMFAYCTNMTLPPVFDNVLNCYGNIDGPIDYIFDGCSSLTRIPNMTLGPVDTWGFGLVNLFHECTSLTDESSRYIKYVDNNKYNYTSQPEINLSHTFEGCTSLTKSPKLINCRLHENCFNGCSSLTEIYYGNPKNAITYGGLYSDMPQSGTVYYPYFAKYDTSEFNSDWTSIWTVQKFWFDELDNHMMWIASSSGGEVDPMFDNMQHLNAQLWKNDTLNNIFTDEGPGSNWTQYDNFNSIKKINSDSYQEQYDIDFGGWTAYGSQVGGYDVYIADNKLNGYDVYAVYNATTNWPEFYSEGFESWGKYVLDFATKPSWLS